MGNESVERMPTRTRVIITVAAVVEVALIGIAHADISHRDPSRVRGSKGEWRAITLITFVGPVWYFLRGRR